MTRLELIPFAWETSGSEERERRNAPGPHGLETFTTTLYAPLESQFHGLGPIRRYSLPLSVASHHDGPNTTRRPARSSDQVRRPPAISGLSDQ